MKVQKVCSSVRVGGRNPKEKAVVKRREAVWKEVLGDRDEGAKERCLKVYKERLKGVYSME